MTDDRYDFAPVPDSRMMLRIATLIAATGGLGGAVEGLVVALRTPMVLSVPDVGLLVIGAVVLNAAVAFAIGLPGGALAQFVLRDQPRWRRYRSGFAIGVGLLVLSSVGPLTWELWVLQERHNTALGTGAAGLCIAVSIWFNAGYYFRREMIGAGPRLGWRLVCLGLSVVLAGVGMLLGGTPRAPGRATLPDAPNLILVTVDTLRRDHIGLYGSVVNTPVLDKLGREGLILDNAVTPVPETAPSHASMFTGMHPSAHGVIANGIPLRRAFWSATEQLDSVGYRTGAFVSSFAVDSATGLAQGFQVYDDDFLPILRGLGDTRVARFALPLLMRFGDPADYPWLLERNAPDTIAHALSWVDSVKEEPVFLWVHLFEPHSPYEPHGALAEVADAMPLLDHRAILAQEPGYAYTPQESSTLRALYRSEVEYTDAQIGELLAGLRARGVLEGAMVVIIGDHGESLGEHGIHFNHHGLYDEVIRVPAIVWADKPTWPAGTRVDRQVWVGDVANTLVEWAGLPLLGGTTSSPLPAHARGVAVPPRPLILLGRMTASLSDGQLWGVRDPTGVKYIRRGSTDELYNLRTDPGELEDISGGQPAAVQSGRTNVETAVQAMGLVLPPIVDDRLEALGYRGQ